MKKLFLALALFLLPSLAAAQCNGVFPNATVCGNASGASNTPRAISPSALLGAAGGTAGQIQYNNAGALSGFTMSGDCTTNTTTGVITCNTFGAAQSGKVPASGGGTTNFLSAAGTWIAPTPPSIRAGALITGAATTYTSSQCGLINPRSNSGTAMSDVLPGTSPGVLPQNCVITIANDDPTGILSIKPGAGSSFTTAPASTGYVYVCPGQVVSFFSNGTTYWQSASSGNCTFGGATTIFLATTGSNTNDGLTASTPLADLQTAYNLLQSSFNTACFITTIKLADGSYTKQINLVGLIPGQCIPSVTYNNYTDTSSIQIIGNLTTPANVVLTSTALATGTITASQGARVAIGGVRIGNTGATAGYGLLSLTGGYIAFGNDDFASAGSGNGIQYATLFGGFIQAFPPYSISGGAGCHFIAGQASGISWLSLNQTPQNITITGTPAYSAAFACAQGGGYMSVDVINTIVGSTTGLRFSINGGGIINAHGNATYFPGSGSTGGTGTAAGIYF